MSDNLDELREALRRRRAKASCGSQTDSDKPDACDLNLKPNLKLGRLELADDSAETYTDKDASLSSKDNTIIIDYDRAPLIITDHLYRDYVKYQFPAMCCVFLIFLFFAVIVVGPPELGVLRMFILVPLPLIEAARREGEAYFVMTNSTVAYYKKGEIVKFFELQKIGAMAVSFDCRWSWRQQIPLALKIVIAVWVLLALKLGGDDESVSVNIRNIVCIFTMVLTLLYGSKIFMHLHNGSLGFFGIHDQLVLYKENASVDIMNILMANKDEYVQLREYFLAVLNVDIDELRRTMSVFDEKIEFKKFKF